MVVYVSSFFEECSMEENMTKFRNETDDERKIDDDDDDDDRIGGRLYSKTLLELLKKHDRDLECESSDIVCLKKFIKENVAGFSTDFVKLERELKQLVDIFSIIVWNTRTLKQNLTNVT